MRQYQYSTMLTNFVITFEYVLPSCLLSTDGKYSCLSVTVVVVVVVVVVTATTTVT